MTFPVPVYDVEITFASGTIGQKSVQASYGGTVEVPAVDSTDFVEPAGYCAGNGSGQEVTCNRQAAQRSCAIGDKSPSCTAHPIPAGAVIRGTITFKSLSSHDSAEAVGYGANGLQVTTRTVNVS